MKNIFKILLVILGAVVLASPALAVTIVSLSPASINVGSGQNFNVSITVNPQGVSNYVEKVELKYPADILEVKSFTLGNAWMALTQPGYDLIDNTNGVLLKSAGYPSGFSSATTFGTVSFYAKKAGNGKITVGNNSLAFEVNSQSSLSGSPVLFTITVPTVTPSKPSTIKNPAVSPSIDSQPVNAVSDTNTIESTSSAEKVSASILDSTVSFSVKTILLFGLLAIVIFIIIVYGVKKSRRKN